MKSITLAIPDTTADKLAELARGQYRAPRQQAAAMLVEAIDLAVPAARPTSPGVTREATSKGGFATEVEAWLAHAASADHRGG